MPGQEAKSFEEYVQINLQLLEKEGKNLAFLNRPSDDYRGKFKQIPSVIDGIDLAQFNPNAPSLEDVKKIYANFRKILESDEIKASIDKVRALEKARPNLFEVAVKEGRTFTQIFERDCVFKAMNQSVSQITMQLKAKGVDKAAPTAEALLNLSRCFRAGLNEQEAAASLAKLKIMEKEIAEGMTERAFRSTSLASGAFQNEKGEKDKVLMINPVFDEKDTEQLRGSFSWLRNEEILKRKTQFEATAKSLYNAKVYEGVAIFDFRKNTGLSKEEISDKRIAQFLLEQKSDKPYSSSSIQILINLAEKSGALPKEQQSTIKELLQEADKRNKLSLSKLVSKEVSDQVKDVSQSMKSAHVTLEHLETKYPEKREDIDKLRNMVEDVLAIRTQYAAKKGGFDKIASGDKHLILLSVESTLQIQLALFPKRSVEQISSEMAHVLHSSAEQVKGLSRISLRRGDLEIALDRASTKYEAMAVKKEEVKVEQSAAARAQAAPAPAPAPSESGPSSTFHR